MRTLSLSYAVMRTKQLLEETLSTFLITCSHIYRLTSKLRAMPSNMRSKQLLEETFIYILNHMFPFTGWPRSWVRVYSFDYDLQNVPAQIHVHRTFVELRQRLECVSLLRLQLRQVVPRCPHRSAKEHRWRHLRGTLLESGAQYRRRGQSLFSFWKLKVLFNKNA